MTENFSGIKMKIFEPRPQSKIKQSTGFMLAKSRGTCLIWILLPLWLRLWAIFIKNNLFFSSLILTRFRLLLLPTVGDLKLTRLCIFGWIAKITQIIDITLISKCEFRYFYTIWIFIFSLHFLQIYKNFVLKLTDIRQDVLHTWYSDKSLCKNNHDLNYFLYNYLVHLQVENNCVYSNK